MTEHIRTCRGCHQKDKREILLRYVLSCEKTLIEDRNKAMQGRGMWVHENPNCMKKAFNKTNIRRAFKIKDV